MSAQQYNVTNYLVPAAGQTHAVKIEATLTSSPITQDWREFSVDNFPFQPQGVFIDNTDGTGEVTVTVKPIDYVIKCAAGKSSQFQFPAPNGQSVEITGNGVCRLFFVDFPVLPSEAEVSLTGTNSVAVTSLPTPVLITGSALASGSTAYQVAYKEKTALEYYGSNATSVALNPADNTYLRKLHLALTSDAALASAGNVALTVTLDGTQVFKREIYIPAAAANTPGNLWEAQLDFSDYGFASGTGNLVATLATGLATGLLECEGWFST